MDNSELKVGLEFFTWIVIEDTQVTYTVIRLRNSDLQLWVQITTINTNLRIRVIMNNNREIEDHILVIAVIQATDNRFRYRYAYCCGAASFCFPYIRVYIYFFRIQRHAIRIMARIIVSAMHPQRGVLVFRCETWTGNVHTGASPIYFSALSTATLPTVPPFVLCGPTPFLRSAHREVWIYAINA